MWETLNISMCAESITNPKLDHENGEKLQKAAINNKNTVNNGKKKMVQNDEKIVTNFIQTL